jgi:acetyltransferase-like isoleucine patch superfamily enzyme
MIQNKYSLKRDILGYTFHYLRTLVLISSYLPTSIYLEIKCYLYNIHLGKGSRFYGITKLYRRPHSNITIGKKSTFHSLSTSNLIGVNRRCIISTSAVGASIKIGDNCGFSGTVIGAFSSIILGDNVRCGANTLITDSDWHLDDPRSGKPAPILIMNNVWLGEGSKVLKGVTIGENSVIGAGSIVVKDIPSNVIAAGNPCKTIKSII